MRLTSAVLRVTRTLFGVRPGDPRRSPLPLSRSFVFFCFRLLPLSLLCRAGFRSHCFRCGTLSVSPAPLSCVRFESSPVSLSRFCAPPLWRRWAPTRFLGLHAPAPPPPSSSLPVSVFFCFRLLLLSLLSRAGFRSHCFSSGALSVSLAPLLCVRLESPPVSLCRLCAPPLWRRWAPTRFLGLHAPAPPPPSSSLPVFVCVVCACSPSLSFAPAVRSELLTFHFGSSISRLEPYFLCARSAHEASHALSLAPVRILL